ncbi:MAG TPA: UDP-N-acetylmuramoyl-tripeptide--D-alanyl-D-alanine ligase [Marinobacter sp.]|uniref:UDP-N-acetylmuramoyl-tripeptide--D-alanyl-D- alanine ligase n=1 Tax=Marinobacter sp. TaxID=50741 RepID=UPI002639C2AC|nr:UDP-N-acetylmuramoyl-tripeptide--D-alanyl-D-alanine ligase [Marinobacter sp.]HET8801972.1 UDP-N-acetylmuramoyl-tripeptide--D-alanyl-D-alanine ligase [Marinobacter sp.]
MMRSFSLAEALRWTQAQSATNNLERYRVEGVSTDTRSLEKGQLFVALRGEHFDGHRFLGAALERGACGAVVDVPDDTLVLPQLVVADTLEALARLAEANRRECPAPLVAITGSSGKTTVKEMVAAALSRMGPTLSTRGNLNNHIGVPLTLFGLSPEHRFGVIELGASGLGEIAHTVAMTRPQVAILTNAGQAHLEGFGSYDNIVEAKGEIIEGVVEGGLVVLNRDDPAFGRWRARAGERRVVSVSRQAHPEADYGVVAERAKTGGWHMRVTGPNGWGCTVSLALEGEHNVTNALLAMAAARDLGASDTAIVEGLSAVQPVNGRLQMLTLSPELTVIDDSYNANPASMKAALRVLSERPGLRVAVLGAMAELGAEADALHREVGECARQEGIEHLLTVGDGCRGYVEGFGPAATSCQSHEEAVDTILRHKGAPVTVLVKGSRSSAMERVVEGIKTKVNNACCSG